MAMTEQEAREAVVHACRQMNTLGINQGTSGNVSARFGDRMLISPSATPYERMTPEMVASIPLEGDPEAWEGPLKPSTEWRFHHGILRGRPEANAVLHAHPAHCTALAMARRGIPACHYMVAAFGGNDVRCAPYATFGTAELAAHVLAAMEGRNACLMANHGMTVCAPGMDKALWLAVELKTIARQYWLSLQVGGPVMLTDAEIADTHKCSSTYGLREERRSPVARRGAAAE